MAKGSTPQDSATSSAAGLISNPQQAVAEAALKQAKLGEEWLNFSKEQFTVSQERQTQLDALVKSVTDRQMAMADEQAGWAREDRSRYDTVFKPVEDQFVAEASNYGTPERQEAAAAEAKADVGRAVADARATGLRQASALGINPESGRFAGIDRAAELSGALATAGAANTARQTVRDKALGLKADVVALGRGLPPQASGEMASSINTGNSAAGLNMQNQNLSNAATGIVGNGYSGALQGYGGLGSTAAGLLGEQNKDQAGIWGALGTVGGAVAGALPWASILSDEELKTDKAPIPEGEALEAVNDMPVEAWRYKDGVADEGRHVGTYAQDFAAATGEGDGRTIPIGDAIGITMKAVQDLDGKVQRIERAVGLGKGGAAKPKLKRAA